jgi:hypothetical protein
MGGSSNSASRQAEQQERERQAAIAASTGRINKIYNDPARQGQYDQLVRDTQQFYQRDLDRQKGDTDRQLKFALARGGQTGGSVSIDQNKQVGEDYLRGVLEANRRAQGAGADLRQADEQARSNLLAMAQSGLDATTASSQAAASMRNNLLSGQSGATAQGLGNMFGSMSDVFRQSRDAAEMRRGQKFGMQQLYSPMFGTPTGGRGGP